MRAFAASAWIALAAAGCAGGGHHDDHGPAGIPYVCGDGKPLRVTHEGGGSALRAEAHVAFDGRTHHLHSAPGAAGLRYVSEPEEGAVTIWTESGEEGRLSRAAIGEAEASDGAEIARCTRLREGEAGHTEPEHPPGH